MAYIVHENQLQQMLEDLRQENPWVSDDALLSFIVNNPDIQIMKSGKIWDTQKITDYVLWKTEEELNEIFWMNTDEWWNVIDSKPKPTKEEKIDYSKQFDDNEYTKIWEDGIKWFDETEPFMSNAEKVATAYRKLRDEKNRITDEYDSWQGWDSDAYMQKIKSISNAMWQAENSPEFKYLVNHVKENWVTWEDKNFSPIVSTTLTDMAYHNWSLFWLKPAKGTWWRVSNWLLWDVSNSWLVRFMQWVTPQKENSLESLPEIYSESNKKINEIINKNKWKSNSKAEDVKNDNKNDISVNWPFKPMNPTDGKATDEMSFGDDVKWAGGSQYLDERNKSLALHLKMKWIETPEEIDAYLSKYPSWQNAKQEWKDNTLWILSDKISNMKWWLVSWKKEENTDDEVKDETKEWRKGKSIEIKDRERLSDRRAPDNDSSINWIEESTAEPMYDDKWNIVGTQRSEAYLYDKSWKPIWSKKSDKYLYDKNWKPIWSKWMPSNDDSINWIEEDIAEPMIDENWKVVWTQRSEAYLYDKNGKPVWSKKSDKYIYDKNGKPVWSKVKDKKEEKKENDNWKYTEPMYDKNWKIVWTQRSDAYLYGKDWNPVASKKSDKYVYDKKWNTVWSKASNKEEKKETNKWKKLNIVKWSETIKNLLKRSKK